ncbi:MAG: cytochrome c3 family protein [Pseudomonadota bacterium]
MALVALSLCLWVPLLASAASPWKTALSPGPLHAEHAEFEGECESCHENFKGTPDGLCLSCHVAIENLIEAREGFHGDLDGAQCVDCHGDHRGREASPTLSAVSKEFDHSHSRFALRGAHTDIECNACHSVPLERVQEQSANDCAGCHEDFHASEFVGGFGVECTLCHSEQSFIPTTKTQADHLLPMFGGHADATCQDCHTGGSHYSEATTCSSCHEQDHGGTELECDSCHSVHEWEQTHFDHGSYVLPSNHDTLQCLSCHQDFHFENTGRECHSCHDADRTHEPMGECNLCHTTTIWQETAEFRHDLDTAFPLTGLHAQVSCGDCHSDGEEFSDAPETCDGCHRAEAMPVHGDLSRIGDCSSCHDTAGFSEPSFDHSEFGFPLLGKHQFVDCLDCHADFAANSEIAAAAYHADHRVGTAQPRTRVLPASHYRGNWFLRTETSAVAVFAQLNPNWMSVPTVAAAQPGRERKLRSEVSQLQDLRTCHDCHDNPHGDDFSNACADCHTENGFSPSTFGVLQHAHTAFPLADVHQDTECTDCHESQLFKETPNQCGACHVAPHNESLGDDCLSCHADTEGAQFEHARGMSFAHDFTGFPLERRHTGLQCSLCHAAGQETPVGECASCHLDPHAGGMSPECELCHRPDRWRLSRFDHDLAGWPLRGRHHSTPCASCHVNQRWVGVPTDCFDCHALDAGRANALRGDHPFGLFDCLDCHVSQVNWRLVR